MSSTPINFDLTNQTTEQIKTLIQTIIDYYNSHESSFGDASDTTGNLYRTNIPGMVAQLQLMVESNPATDYQELLNKDVELDKEIVQAKEDLNTAETRVSSLRNSHKQSYYESWFPLNRPLRTSSNIIILSIGIFFFILSFLLILQSAGIRINIGTTWYNNGVPSPTLEKLRILFPFGYGTTIAFLAVVIIAVVGYLKKA